MVRILLSLYIINIVEKNMIYQQNDFLTSMSITIFLHISVLCTMDAF